MKVCLVGKSIGVLVEDDREVFVICFLYLIILLLLRNSFNCGICIGGVDFEFFWVRKESLLVKDDV